MQGGGGSRKRTGAGDAWIRSRREQLARAKRDGISDALARQDLGRGRAGRARAAARSSASAPSSTAWTPAPPSSRASRRICTPATNRECEADPSDRKKVMILGSGPNRIGQGIEFDYCCCHASFALQEFGVESIMVNCNPETVSTDYDTSDRLYFEPLTLEDVLNICDTEKPDGVIVQFGGQTPLDSGAAAEARWACPSSAPTPPTSTWPRTASCSASCSTSWAFPRPPTAPPPAWKRPARWPGASAIPCWCGPATCWAAAPW